MGRCHGRKKKSCFVSTLEEWHKVCFTLGMGSVNLLCGGSTLHLSLKQLRKEVKAIDASGLLNELMLAACVVALSFSSFAFAEGDEAQPKPAALDFPSARIEGGTLENVRGTGLDASAIATQLAVVLWGEGSGRCCGRPSSLVVSSTGGVRTVGSASGIRQIEVR